MESARRAQNSIKNILELRHRADFYAKRVLGGGSADHFVCNSAFDLRILGDPMDSVLQNARSRRCTFMTNVSWPPMGAAQISSDQPRSAQVSSDQLRSVRSIQISLHQVRSAQIS